MIWPPPPPAPSLLCTQFNKLERVEIGGTKGKVLTNGVKAIHTDFTTAVERFKAVEYDVMDTDAKQFDEDFYAFRVVVKELERRLAAIIIQVRGRKREGGQWGKGAGKCTG